MLPGPGELLHFSEDPSIRHFSPHVAATAQQPEAYVWTVDALNAPCYWFPRQCPRVCSWGDGAARVHAVEERWLSTMRAATLYAYRFAAADLVRLHEMHDIELRVLGALEDHFAVVREAGLEFSAIRMGNAGLGPLGPFATRRRPGS